MRPRCTLAEVTHLARGDNLEGARSASMGGVKGASTSIQPTTVRVRRARLVHAVRPLLARYRVAADDLGLGTQQTELELTFEQVGLGKSSFYAAWCVPDERAARARAEPAFNRKLDELRLADLIGGFSVAEATLGALGHVCNPSGRRDA
jgi:glutamate dehydrogenase (NAD(P)+)